jgi:hypothetical protein
MHAVDGQRRSKVAGEGAPLEVDDGAGPDSERAFGLAPSNFVFFWANF